MIEPMLGHTASRRLVAASLALALLAPGATVLAAASSDMPCAEMVSHDCGTPVLEPGCCDLKPADSPAPARLPQARTEASASVASAASVSAMPSFPPGLDILRAAAVRFHSPPAGYRSTSLTILLSVFLI
jgi:hypothetical protein